MTFTTKVEQEANKGYLEVVLPSLEESATWIASAGLEKLLKESYKSGLSTKAVTVVYDGYSEEDHRVKLAMLIRKKVFIDVKVGRRGYSYAFELAPAFSYGTGSRNYREPVYRVRRGEGQGLYTNVTFLKRKKVRGLRCLAFLKVCEFFNITERFTEFLSVYTPPEGIECSWHCDFLNLIEVVFIWLQKHPKKLLDLHQSGDPAKVYSQLDFRASDSSVPWTDRKRDGCLAHLDELLKE